MQLYKLDSTFLPATLIEKYDSLIWTERYRNAGDFELKTPHIDATMTQLPIGTTLSLADTKEIMIVENHIIDTNDNDQAILTVSGRSYETFFEYRPALDDLLPIHYTAGGVDYIWEIAALDAGATAASIMMSVIESPYANDTKDILPLHQVSGAGPALVSTKNRIIERTDTYSKVLDLLDEEDLGIKNVRRNPGDSNDVNIYVYYGTDRTATVVLDPRAGHFLSSKYLFSQKGYWTGVYATSKDLAIQVHNPGSSGLTGRNRRMGLVLARDIEGTSANETKMLTARAVAELGKHRKTAIFEGEVSPDIPYKYGTHYFIGDTVKCHAEYGVDQNMRVVEYIRVEDGTGERAFPTLSVIGDYQ